MPKKTFAAAMIDAVSYALAEDPKVALIGASSFVLERGLPPELEQALFDRFPDRLIDPPTSESIVASLATGAAMAGMRPFVNFGTASFAFEAWNQIINETGNARLMSGGQLTVPLVFHMFHGVRGGGGAQHSQSPQAWFANAAGLELVLPATPADAQGLIRTAIRSDNPTVVISHTKLLGTSGEVPDGDFAIPFGRAAVARPGRDVTIVATSLMVQEALKAAGVLAGEGIEAEVVDPRTIVPLDRATVCNSVRKTGRLVTVDEAVLTCSIASEIAAMVAEEAFDALRAPIQRVGRPNAPVAYAPPLEAFVTPTAGTIAAAARKAMGR